MNDSSLLKKLAAASKEVKASRMTPKAKFSKMRNIIKTIMTEYFENPARLTSDQYNTITNILSNHPGILNDGFRPRYSELFLYPNIISLLEKNPDKLYCAKDLKKYAGLHEFSEYMVTNAMSRLSESMDSDIIAQYNIGHVRSYKFNPKCADALRFDWISYKPACRASCKGNECMKQTVEEKIDTRLKTKKRLADECLLMRERSKEELLGYVKGDKSDEANMFTLFGVAHQFFAAGEYENAIRFYERAMRSIEEVRKTKPFDEGVRHVEYELFCMLGQSCSGEISKKYIERAIKLEQGNAYARLLDLKHILEDGGTKELPKSKLLYFLEDDGLILRHEIFGSTNIDRNIKVFRCD